MSTRTAILVLLALLPATAGARKNGLAGASGQGAATCNDCHSGGATPTVQLTGPAMLEAGATGSYHFLITGGAAKVGGLGVSVDDPGATLQALSDAVRVVGATQLVHNAPVPFTDGSLRFDFDLTAPSYPTTLSIYAAGNSCDGDGEKLGDRAATTSLKVSILGPVGAGGTSLESQSAAAPQTGCSYAAGSRATDGTLVLALGWLLMAYRFSRVKPAVACLAGWFRRTGWRRRRASRRPATAFRR